MSETAAEPAISARHMVRRGLKGALATVDAATGAPYSSMILLATDIGGAPLTLISTLARHTRNLAANPVASLMIDLSNAAGDAESGGRITLAGRLTPVAKEVAKVRFLARHPASAGYADFADFAFYRLEIDTAHMIEGFGRIVTLPAAALAPPPFEPANFADQEPYALVEIRRRWPHVSGLDPEGADLRYESQSDRLRFPHTVTTVEAAARAAANCLVAASLNTGQ